MKKEYEQRNYIRLEEEARIFKADADVLDSS